MLHQKSCVMLLVVGLTIFVALPIAAQEAVEGNVARLLNTWLQGVLDGLAEVTAPDAEGSDAMDNASEGRLENSPESVQGCYPPGGRPNCVPLGDVGTELDQRVEVGAGGCLPPSG